MEIQHIILSVYIIICVHAAQEKSTSDDTTGKQSKRGTPELSYSYAATDIGSKGGTHIKTITIIKNYGQKEKPLKINPELHKDEDWGSKFRDNFDSFGKIPEIPDILNPHYLKEETSQTQKEKSKEVIPIHEDPVEDILDDVEDKKEQTEDINNDAEVNGEESKDINKKEESNNNKKDDFLEDVEVIEAKSTNIKEKKESLRLLPLISLIPNINKPQNYYQQVSALNTRPYHQLIKTPYTNQQELLHTSVHTPSKSPENYKFTYSPLLYTPTPMQPLFNNKNSFLVPTADTTQIPQPKKPQSRSTTTQLPYIAPNLKKSYKSINSAAPSTVEKEVSNVITKTRNKPITSVRSRGIKYISD